MTEYHDIADHDEDTRINMIGRVAMEQKKRVAFVTDDTPDDPGKADRYIAKLQERFPGIRIINRGPGPVANAVYVTVGPPVN